MEKKFIVAAFLGILVLFIGGITYLEITRRSVSLSQPQQVASIPITPSSKELAGESGINKTYTKYYL